MFIVGQLALKGREFILISSILIKTAQSFQNYDSNIEIIMNFEVHKREFRCVIWLAGAPCVWIWLKAPSYSASFWKLIKSHIWLLSKLAFYRLRIVSVFDISKEETAHFWDQVLKFCILKSTMPRQEEMVLILELPGKRNQSLLFLKAIPSWSLEIIYF